MKKIKISVKTPDATSEKHILNWYLRDVRLNVSKM